ncbi:MAG: hypothetical protein IPJ84_01985 [Bdellovibrionales bacterium]|nr:hypothetical protein [Bdellovibrionales bacterium]
MAKNQGIIVTPDGFTAFFSEAVQTAFAKRGFSTFPSAQTYLVKLLEYYVPTANFFDEVDEQGRRTRSTLAEAFLKAVNQEPQARNEQLKRLADRALYITGFFGDSLQRKLVDIDYYCEMGVTAYSVLADSQKEDMAAKVYREYSSRFLNFSEVLTTISAQAHLQNEANILRLYETYAKTGSDLAREQLLERGLIAVPLSDLKKPTKQ